MIILCSNIAQNPSKLFMHRPERAGGLRWHKAVTVIVTKHFVAPVVSLDALRFASL